jgi:hypothetical protein
MREKVVPFVYEVMSKPLQQLVHERLEAATKADNLKHAHVLRQLLKDQRYFTLTEPRTMVEKALYAFGAAKALTGYAVERASKRMKRWRVSLSGKDKIVIHAARTVSHRVLTNADDYSTVKALKFNIQ